ncbi:MAG TPA: hypothetical protein VMV25_13870 [Steroidobacteraceae bacterium]|nr:hypothetical protein [Steroidobacteraceae bacterium]
MARSGMLAARIGGLAVLTATSLTATGVAQASTSSESAGAVAVPRSLNPGHDDYLQAVQSLSPSNAWAVGYYCSASCGKSAEVDRSLILHWNGTAWSRVPSPNAGTQDTLFGVTAVSAGDAWAAGTSFSSAKGFRPLILHWNGKAWSNDSPAVAGVFQVSAIFAESAADAWAVGSRISGPTIATLILHWNGKTWSKVTSPSPSRSRNSLYGVSAVSRTDAWAVGGYCASHCSGPTAPVDHSLILHWNGKSWSKVPSPTITGADLHSVSALSATNAWAAGFGNSANLMLRWNGTRWSKVNFPNQSPAFSITLSSPTDGWAVGFGGFTHWNGTNWSLVPVSTPLDSNLQGVSADGASDAWAVGFYCVSKCGSRSIVWNTETMHWNGKSWSRK